MLNRNIEDSKVSVFAARFSVVPGRPHRYDVDGKEAAGLTGEQRAELAALAELPEDEIDTTDIPEVLDWSHARSAALISTGRSSSRSPCGWMPTSWLGSGNYLLEGAATRPTSIAPCGNTWTGPPGRRRFRRREGRGLRSPTEQ